MSYTPPSPTAADFDFSTAAAYTPPSATEADFSFASGPALPIEGYIEGIGILGVPEVSASQSFGYIEGVGILGIPQMQANLLAAYIEGVGILGTPQMLASMAAFARCLETAQLSGEAISSLEISLAEIHNLTEGLESQLTYNIAEPTLRFSPALSVLYGDLNLAEYPSFGENAVPTAELNFRASQPLSLTATMAAVFPFLLQDTASLSTNPVAAIERTVRLAEAFIQFDLLRNLSETTGRAQENFGLLAELAPILNGTVSETLSLQETVAWDVRSALLAAERWHVTDAQRVGLELGTALRETARLTERMGFGLGLLQLQSALLSSGTTLDVKQLLSALEGIQLRSNVGALLELATTLRDGLTGLDRVRFGLLLQLIGQVSLADALAQPITLMQAREIMAVGLTLTATAELPIHLAEALRATSISSPTLGLLAAESLGLLGNMLAEVYFGARAAETIALQTNPAAALEIGRLAREMVVLTETTGFSAQWLLAEGLLAQVLALPDSMTVLQAIEGFDAQATIAVLTELNATLRERWTAFDKLGLLYGMRAETLASLGSSLTLDVLRWAQATELLGLNEAPVPTMELVARLTALAQLADSAGLAFGVSGSEGLQLSSTLPGVVVRVKALTDSLGVSSTTALTLELTARLLELVTAQEVVGALDRLTATEVVTLADNLSRAIQTTITSEETLGLTSQVSQSLTVIVRDEAQWASASTNLVELLIRAGETLAFIGSLPLEEGDYQAWVMNTDTLGVTTYNNTMFDRLVTHKGKTLGLTPTGLYELTGDTDDGSPIDAWIRTGQIHLNTEHAKNISRAYLYVKQEGDLYLRTIATTYGCRQEHWYKIHPNIKDGDAEATHRLRLRRTVFALSWSFEIHNVSGSDFDLRGAEILPVILRRRT